MMLLAFGTPSFDYLAKQLIHLFVKLMEQSLDSSNQWKNHAYLVSQHFEAEYSVQAKNLFLPLPYGSSIETCTNTLFNNSDDQCFISQNFFHYEYYLGSTISKIKFQNKVFQYCGMLLVLNHCWNHHGIPRAVLILLEKMDFVIHIFDF